ncbi:uridine kinase-like protein 3 [Fagus crenata]
MPASVSVSVSVSSSLVILVWTTTLIINVATTVAKSQSSWSLEKELKALKQTGWGWPWLSEESTSSPCQLLGIVCTDSGSVKEINLNNIVWIDSSHVECTLCNFNFSSFPNLAQLNLAGVGLRGSIPPEIGSVSKLTHLNLSQNYLSGELPLSLTNLTQLINGTIPSELGKLKTMVSLDLSNNMLIGPLPHILGCLTKLTHLFLDSNQINGSINPIIGDLKLLILLDLSSNEISGMIPNELTQLTQLQNLSLASNRLSGSLPPDMKDLLSLSVLDLSYNMLSGPFPTQIALCHRLKQLYLNENHFNGSIPPQVANLFRLTTINLSHNLFGGEIPSDLGYLKYLQYLDLSYNNLTGIIPKIVVSQCSVDLSYNSLEGEIPNGFWTYNTFWGVLGNKDLCSNNVVSGFLNCSSQPRSPQRRNTFNCCASSIDSSYCNLTFPSDAFDTEKLLRVLEKLRHGQAVDIPNYDFKSYKNNVNPSDVILLEGILIFHDQHVRDLMNMKIFVDTDADVRLARRIRRDTVEKSRDIGTVLECSKFVKPAFDDFILPTKKYADIIIPRGGDNHVAIDLIIQHIRTKLGQHDLCKIYPNLYVIHSTFQWAAGFATFWYPSGSRNSRAALLPWHVFLGVYIYAFAVVTATTGILKKATFLQTNNVISSYSTEAMLVNSLGILIVVLGGFVTLAIVTSAN